MTFLPNSQRYPWNLYLINNVEDIVIFLDFASDAWSDKPFQGTVVNPTLHGGLLEITLYSTFPLIFFYSLLPPILLSRCKAIIEEAVKWAPDTMRSHLKEYINNKVQQGDVWAPQGYRLEKGGYLFRIIIIIQIFLLIKKYKDDKINLIYIYQKHAHFDFNINFT